MRIFTKIDCVIMAQHCIYTWVCLPCAAGLSQIANFMGPTWGPPGSCRPQMGPMLAPWTLLSGMFSAELSDPSLCNSFEEFITGYRNDNIQCSQWWKSYLFALTPQYHLSRVYPRHHAYGIVATCLVWSLFSIDLHLFIDILQGYFTGTEALIWFPQCQWRNTKQYE